MTGRFGRKVNAGKIGCRPILHSQVGGGEINFLEYKIFYLLCKISMINTNLIS